MESLKKSVKFEHGILMIGFGAVASCTLPLLEKQVDMPLQRITIIDERKPVQLEEWEQKGVKFIKSHITKDNLESIIKQNTFAGDIVIDLAYELDTLEFLKICFEHGVLYLNASIEEWEPYGKVSAYEQTLYFRHMHLRKWLQTLSKKGPTAVLDHGANPGLISHFVKQGLVDIATKLIAEGKGPKELKEILEKAKNERSFGELAMILGVKVIHCSERDTQLTNNPKKPKEFVNTWSVEGFYEEGIAPAELGWGIHEKKLPRFGEVPPEGPKNVILLQTSGIDVLVRSFVPPDHNIVGMVIRHGEAISISERLSVWKDGKVIYRPTVHYAYMPCDSAIASLQELRGRNYEMQPNQRILREKEIIEGNDILGALLMGHEFKSWWTGSNMSIEESRRLVPGQNATTVQVAAGVLGAIIWMIKNPNEGVCLPDDLPYDFILDIAKPYLGEFISSPYNWDPVSKRKNLFENQIITADTWQFDSFLYNVKDL